MRYIVFYGTDGRDDWSYALVDAPDEGAATEVVQESNDDEPRWIFAMEASDLRAIADRTESDRADYVVEG